MAMRTSAYIRVYARVDLRSLAAKSTQLYAGIRAYTRSVSAAL